MFIFVVTKSARNFFHQRAFYLFSTAGSTNPEEVGRHGATKLTFRQCNSPHRIERKTSTSVETLSLVNRHLVIAFTHLWWLIFLTQNVSWLVRRLFIWRQRSRKNHIPDDIPLFFNHDINICSCLYHPMDMATSLTLLSMPINSGRIFNWTSFHCVIVVCSLCTFQKKLGRGICFVSKAVFVVNGSPMLLCTLWNALIHLREQTIVKVFN